MKKFVLFGKQLQDVISMCVYRLIIVVLLWYIIFVVDSLSWDSFEQFCFWQLLIGEAPDVHHIIPVLKHITTPTDHPEAVTGLILLLRQEPYVMDTPSLHVMIN